MTVLGPSRPARASEESISRREHRTCVELRDAGKLAEAAPHCRAAYDALPDDTREPPLNARSLIVFDGYNTYLEAFEATNDIVFLCAGEELLTEYLAYLDARLPAEARPDDRQDAQKDLAELAARRGDQKCSEPVVEPLPRQEDLLPVVLRPQPQQEAPPPTPGSGLRIAGGVTLGTGIALGLVAAGALAYGARIRDERDRLTNAPEPVGPEGHALADRLDGLGTRANRLAVGTAITSGAAIVTSIVLLAVDAHRRRGQRLSIAPVVWPAGGHLSLRF
ncbi:hypothetical protein [Nannocystis pusilla]|uniref:Uncharacterized protein n=1 Tax=Nannocystis pusilla TaxID=889268 RepID=A0ABS7U3G5_9BACT|nr:hypothetical protein [Nannocystis pusilla]MBZ5714887.1 hypothetical protein [Nannocystis pusilla]